MNKKMRNVIGLVGISLALIIGVGSIDITMEVLASNREAKKLAASRINSHVFVSVFVFGSGSGTFISSDSILTAQHVVGDMPPELILVRLSDNTWVKVKEVISYVSIDAAVLILEREVENVNIAKVANKPLKAKDFVWFDGTPLGGDWGRQLYREGYVMGVIDGNESYPNLVISEIAATYGDSGSGVYNEDDELVGIIVLKTDRWTGILPVECFKHLL